VHFCRWPAKYTCLNTTDRKVKLRRPYRGKLLDGLGAKIMPMPRGIMMLLLAVLAHHWCSIVLAPATNSVAPPASTVSVTPGTINRIDESFHCWTVEPSPRSGFDQRNLSHAALSGNKLYYTARLSLPGHIRFGGNGANGLRYFNCSDRNSLHAPLGDGAGAQTGRNALGTPVPPRCLNESWADNMLSFANHSCMRGNGQFPCLVVSLNRQARTADGRWDPMEARALIRRGLAHFPVDLRSFPPTFLPVNPTQPFFGFDFAPSGEDQDLGDPAGVAADYAALHALVSELFAGADPTRLPADGGQPKLLSPTISVVERDAASGAEAGHFLQTFAMECHRLGVPLFALSYSQTAGAEAGRTRATMPTGRELNASMDVARKMHDTLGATGLALWASDAADSDHIQLGEQAQPAGEAGSFAEIFWTLDGMGSSAQLGHSVWCRAPFLGAAGIIDERNYDPHPIFWGGYAWSQLMGTGVLQVRVSLLLVTCS
jgi:hypothetical protein